MISQWLYVIRRAEVVRFLHVGPKWCVALIIFAISSYFMDTAKLVQLLQEKVIPFQVKQHSVWLPNYRFVERVALPGIKANASDIIYVAETQSYFVLVNSPALLYEYAEDFSLKARYELQGFEDPEAITYDGNGSLLIGEERRQTVVTLPLSHLTASISRDGLRYVTIDERADNNRGLEGMAFDPQSQILFASREERPVRLFEMSGVVEPLGQTNTSMPYRADATFLSMRRLGASDVSAMHLDRRTHHLLVLSDQSRSLVELDSMYAKVSTMDLRKGFNGLTETVPQAEGVTIGPKHELIIVSEPNLLYRFEVQGER